MNKSFVTNLVAFLFFIVAYFVPEFTGRFAILQSSLFALSGALTNWLAVYMLFEKIPGLYGSGIIPNRFEDFKAGIRSLIMDNFFTEENFLKVTNSANSNFDLENITKQIDFNELFESFLKIVENSSFGNMLSMFGGSSILEPLREPFKQQFSQKVPEILNKIDFKQVFQKNSNFQSFRPKIEEMIDARLQELTPQIVKEIVSKMIREHLGWLVVWGGVLGAVIGLGTSFLTI